MRAARWRERRNDFAVVRWRLRQQIAASVAADDIDRHAHTVRDPFGVRPLVLGMLEGAPILASETCALDIIGAEFVRDVKPGEMVVITHEGIESHFPFNPVLRVPEARLEISRWL